MANQLLTGVTGILFLLVELFVIVMFFIVRYHFRSFAAPYDTRATHIVRIFGTGIFISIIAAAFIFFRIIL